MGSALLWFGMPLRNSRGLFRLWLVASVFWIAAVGVFSWWQYQNDPFVSLAHVHTRPSECDGMGFDDCLKTLKRLGRNEWDAFLPTEQVVRVGAEQVHAAQWKIIQSGAVLALVPPIILLVVGSALGWASRHLDWVALEIIWKSIAFVLFLSGMVFGLINLFGVGHGPVRFFVNTNFFMFMVLGTAASAAYYQANKIRQRGRDEDAIQIFNAASSREFCVYLRPFYVTKKIRAFVRDDSGSVEWDLENRIIGALQLPVIALGKPGEALGVGRILVDEEAWKSAISELTKRAALIICVPSSHPGSLWELNHLIESEYLTKTLFLMPPSEASPKEMQQDWAQLVESMRIKGIAFPNYRPRAWWAPYLKPHDGTLFAVDPAGGCVADRFLLRSTRSIAKAIERLRPQEAKHPRLFQQIGTVPGRQSSFSSSAIPTATAIPMGIAYLPKSKAKGFLWFLWILSLLVTLLWILSPW
jgi:hypothetical protein